MRFLVGICIVAVSIYGFYIFHARRNSPELFLVPVTITPAEHPCTNASLDGLTMCVPNELQFGRTAGNALSVFSSRARVRGEVRLVGDMPNEGPWRESLRNPFIRAFLGDEKSVGTLDLMKRLLSHRYNPTLMGPKAKIIPSWMKTGQDAQILIPKGSDAIMFYTSRQFLGIKSTDRGMVTLSLTGAFDKALAAGMIHSIRVNLSAGPETGW